MKARALLLAPQFYETTGEPRPNHSRSEDGPQWMEESPNLVRSDDTKDTFQLDLIRTYISLDSGSKNFSLDLVDATPVPEPSAISLLIRITAVLVVVRSKVGCRGFDRSA